MKTKDVHGLIIDLEDEVTHLEAMANLGSILTTDEDVEPGIVWLADQFLREARNLRTKYYELAEASTQRNAIFADKEKANA